MLFFFFIIYYLISPLLKKSKFEVLFFWQFLILYRRTLLSLFYFSLLLAVVHSDDEEEPIIHDPEYYLVKVTPRFPWSPLLYDMTMQEWRRAAQWRRHPWPLVAAGRVLRTRILLPAKWSRQLRRLIPRRGTRLHKIFYFFFNPLERTAFFISAGVHIFHLIATKPIVYGPLYLYYKTRRKNYYKKHGVWRTLAAFGRLDRMLLENLFWETSLLGMWLEVSIVSRIRAFWWKNYFERYVFWIRERLFRIKIRRHRKRNRIYVRFLETHLPGGYFHPHLTAKQRKAFTAKNIKRRRDRRRALRRVESKRQDRINSRINIKNFKPSTLIYRYVLGLYNKIAARFR